MDTERPRTNVSQAFMDNFKVEQERFLAAQAQFKAGYLFQGIVAASFITSMFYLLPASRYIVKNEDEAKKYVDDLDAFRLEAFRFARIKGVSNPTPNLQLPLTEDYMRLDDKLDALVRKFYKIMFETGFSP